MKAESEMAFSDSLTGAFAKLFETRDMKDGNVAYEVLWRGADSGCASGAHFDGNEYDAAFKFYRQRLNEVLDSIEKWDAM